MSSPRLHLPARSTRQLSFEIEKLDLEISKLQEQRQIFCDGDKGNELLTTQRKLARQRLTLIVRRKASNAPFSGLLFDLDVCRICPNSTITSISPLSPPAKKPPRDAGEKRCRAITQTARLAARPYRDFCFLFVLRKPFPPISTLPTLPDCPACPLF